MGKEMQIKGHVIGTKRPIICVPIVERTKENIINTARLMVENQVEMIEWRMDWYEQCRDQQAVKEVLKELSPFIEETVLLCTYRSEAQGGQGDMEEEAYQSLNLAVAQTGVPDLIDLEFFEVQDSPKMIELLHRQEILVVGSNHNFAKTPEIEELYGQFERMQLAGVDFAKVAVMPEKKVDVLHLMEAVLNIKEQYPKSHLIAMSMGESGAVSRLLGQWYHSEVTFASFGKNSAPGQIPYESVKRILQDIEEWT